MLPSQQALLARNCKSLETPLRFGLLQLSPFGRQRHSDRTGAWPEAVYGPILQPADSRRRWNVAVSRCTPWWSLV